MDWELSIRKAGNGFIAEYEEEEKIHEFVFEEEVGGKEIAETYDVPSEELREEDITMHRLLWWVREYFGNYRDKYAKVNLDIVFTKE